MVLTKDEPKIAGFTIQEIKNTAFSADYPAMFKLLLQVRPEHYQQIKDIWRSALLYYDNIIGHLLSYLVYIGEFEIARNFDADERRLEFDPESRLTRYQIQQIRLFIENWLKSPVIASRSHYLLPRDFEQFMPLYLAVFPPHCHDDAVVMAAKLISEIDSAQNQR